MFMPYGHPGLVKGCCFEVKCKKPTSHYIIGKLGFGSGYEFHTRCFDHVDSETDAIPVKRIVITQHMFSILKTKDEPDQEKILDSWFQTPQIPPPLPLDEDDPELGF